MRLVPEMSFSFSFFLLAFEMRVIQLVGWELRQERVKCCYSLGQVLFGIDSVWGEFNR